MNLIILLDRLDQMVDSAPEIPLTGKCLVDAEEVLDLLDKIRNAIPEEVKRAEWLTAEKEKVIQEGQKEAERIVLQAEEYISKIVDESEIRKKAEENAQEIVDAARNEAEELENEASEYACSVLDSLQKSLEKALKIIEEGREQLVDQ